MWRTWETGDRVAWCWSDFDGAGSRVGIVTEIHEDHAIVCADGMNLWVDDDTETDYRRL